MSFRENLFSLLHDLVKNTKHKSERPIIGRTEARRLCQPLDIDKLDKIYFQGRRVEGREGLIYLRSEVLKGIEDYFYTLEKENSIPQRKMQKVEYHSLIPKI